MNRRMLTFLVSLAMTTLVRAQGPDLPRMPEGPGPQNGPGGGMGAERIERFITSPRMVKELGLSEEQVRTIRTAFDGTREKADILNLDLQQAAVEQAKVLLATDLDEAALFAAVEKTGAIRTELAKLHLQPLITLKKTLTPEQNATVRKLMQDRRDQREDRRDRWQDRRDQRRGEGAGRGEGQGRRPGQGANNEPRARRNGQGQQPRLPGICPNCGAHGNPPPPPDDDPEDGEDGDEGPDGDDD